MASPVEILNRCLGLNTKDHPTKLRTQAGQYVAQLVNYAVNDSFEPETREGQTVLYDGLTKAHSLEAFEDCYCIFADGVNLYCYNTDTAVMTTLSTSLTADKPLSYTMVSDVLAWSNGVERGLVRTGGMGDSYFSHVADPLQADREIAEMPVTDLIHYYSGSMYGAMHGESFVYCSEAFRPNSYDKEKGYLSPGAGINWMSSVAGALLVGTDKGLVAYVGSGINDFQERWLTNIKTWLCSGPVSLTFAGDAGEMIVQGVLMLSSKGVEFAAPDLSLMDMTEKVDFRWDRIATGAFGHDFNQFIFSGELT